MQGGATVGNGEEEKNIIKLNRQMFINCYSVTQNSLFWRSC